MAAPPSCSSRYDSAAGEIGHAWPSALPNGKGILFRSRRNLDPTDFDIVAFDFKTRERHVLTKGLLARYVAPGYLVYLRADGAVLAAPFDQDHFKLTGPAVPLFEGVMTKPFGAADLALSATGTLAYVPGLASSAGGVAELVYVTREGSVTPLNPPVTLQPLGQSRAQSLAGRNPHRARRGRGGLAGHLDQAASRRPPLAPDLRRPRLDPAAVDAGRAVRALHLDAGQRALHRSGRSERTAAPRPSWSGACPACHRRGHPLERRSMADLSGQPDAMATGTSMPCGPGAIPCPPPCSPGRSRSRARRSLPTASGWPTPRTSRVPSEIFVRPFPNTNAGRWQISTRGGSAARWAHSGRELFFESAGGDFMVVPIAPGPTFAPGEARRLFPLGRRALRVQHRPVLRPHPRRQAVRDGASRGGQPGAGRRPAGGGGQLE